MHNCMPIRLSFKDFLTKTLSEIQLNTVSPVKNDQGSAMQGREGVYINSHKTLYIFTSPGPDKPDFIAI